MGDGSNCKNIPVGVQTDNECCICCDKCWYGNCKPMYNEEDPEACVHHTGVCPTSCCACPPLGNLCLTISCPKCPTVNGMEFSLRQDMGVCLCSGTVPVTDAHVPCYYDTVIDGTNHTIKTGIQEHHNVYEKWGWTGVICRGLDTAGMNADGSDCAGDPVGAGGANAGKTRGEQLEIALCCCDTCGGKVENTSANPSDCHTCNYQLFLKWSSWTASDDFCTCPDGPDPACPPPCGDETKLVPICNMSSAPPPASCDSQTHDMHFEDGQCPTGADAKDSDRPFILHYSFEDRWWNCDCCQNGGEPGDNDVDMTFTIVEGDGASGLCDSSAKLQPDAPNLPC